jgi:GTPase
MVKQQVARLKRAAKKTPLVLSAVAGHGVPEALRALRQIIDQANAAENPQETAAWQA